mgnify:CR=1 FL=1
MTEDQIIKKILENRGLKTKKQVQELQQTINRADCDVVIDGSPVNLGKLIKVNKPIVNIGYEIKVIGKPSLDSVLEKFIRSKMN